MIQPYDPRNLEDAVKTGPVLAKIYIPKKILLFYTSGVVAYDDSFKSMERVIYNTVITGFSKLGRSGSGPYWQLRGSFGIFWGAKGLMYVEKLTVPSSSSDRNMV